MRIASITTAVVEANYDWTIVRVECEDGLCGRGEAFCAPDGPGIGADLDLEVARRYARPGEPFFGELSA